MKVLSDYFLRAKHWQLFLLFAILFAGQMATMAWASLNPTEGFGGVGLRFWIVEGLFLLCFMAWFWSLGSFLDSLIPSALKLNMGFFRFALIYPIVYVFIFASFIQNPVLSRVAIILPLHLFAMACVFYSLYFVSKSFVLAETGKSASFYDYAGPFFLIWFFPIGIWVVQPRINRLYATGPTGEQAAGSQTLTL